MRLTGCGTALVTPFRKDGSVDEPALQAQVQWQVKSGIDFLVPCGTTGEAATLSEPNGCASSRSSCAASGGRVPVFAGCTHNSTHEAVAKARKLARLPGLTGILTANPYYNRPGQEGQYQHFKAIAEAVELPILLYNIPPRTGANLEPDTVLRLAEIPNIVGIKESSGNLAQITELLTQPPRSFKVFAGDDGSPFPSSHSAARVSSPSRRMSSPRRWPTMVAAALTDDWPTARRINRQFYRLMQAHFWEPSPAPVKAVHGHARSRRREVAAAHGPGLAIGTRRRLERMVGELGLLVGVSGPGDDPRMF